MPSLSDTVRQSRPDLKPLQEFYKKLHQNPELSNQEKETSALVVEQLEKIDCGFDVKFNIGGYGVAAVLKNGDGPAVMLRADFDALPIEEQTGLEYASKKRMKDENGIERPVAHACGHDMHTTCLLGAAHLLALAKQEWSGTLVLIFQPAEERGTGAQAMVDDGLYKKHNVPVPDVVLAGHVLPYRAGNMGTRPGLMANSADSMHVTLHGRGAHSSMPDNAVDPVVMAASTVMRLQTVVSRETDPHDSNVLTVTSLKSGDSDNVIADDANLAIDVRSSTQHSRERVLEGVTRIVGLESEASRAVRKPDIKNTRSYPTTINDADVVKQLSASFVEHFGQGSHGFDPDIAPCGASEDFSNLARAVDKPYCEFNFSRHTVLHAYSIPLGLWTYGGIDPERWDKASKAGKVEEEVPMNHSAKFAPVIMPTLQVGLDAYAVGALTWLLKK